MSSKEPFKVGDRVAIYDCGFRHTGKITKLKPGGGNESVCVLVGPYIEDEYWRHPKQLRRLKPKRVPREFWINSYPDEALYCAHPSLESSESGKGKNRTEVIHVREVLPKKAKP